MQLCESGLTNWFIKPALNREPQRGATIKAVVFGLPPLVNGHRRGGNGLDAT